MSTLEVAPQDADGRLADGANKTPDQARVRLLFVVNADWFFVSHRLPIALGALRQGYEVHLACSVTRCRDELQTQGIYVHDLPIREGGSTVSQAVRSVIGLVRLMSALRPDIVHLVTIGPVVLGGIAARIARVSHVVAAISGMGYVFIARGLRARMRRAAVALLYRLALGSRDLVAIVQNTDDASLLKKLAGLRDEQIRTIRGSGVDLDTCAATPLPDGEPIVVFAARLLADKGLREFVEAARILNQENVAARFIVAGEPDPFNPASITQTEIDHWRREGVVEFTGFCDDVAALFASAHIVVLPSYREGLPKVLLEAAACGRPVVTTDVPGCRDAVEPGRTALLVPVRQALPLASAIRRLVEDRPLCLRMGAAGREMAQAEFSIGRVVDSHLAIYANACEAS